MKLLYFINGMDSGGAEHGFLTLLKTGFFDGFDIRVILLYAGDSKMLNQLRSIVTPDRILLATDRDRPSIRCLYRGARICYEQLKSWQPDVMVLSLKQANIIGRFLARFRNVYTISFEHSTKYSAKRLSIIYPPLLKLLSFSVQEVWADCTETMERVRKHYRQQIRHEKIVHLLSDQSCIGKKTNYEVARPVRIVTASRLIPGKRVDRIITGLASLKELDFSLDIFGDGPCMPDLRRLVSSLGLDDACKFNGYVGEWTSRSDDFDFFVHLSEHEGFCITVAEAMLSGLPVITTDVGGIRDYGIDNVNCLKVPMNEVDEWTKALNNLLKSTNRREEIGNAARRDMGYKISGQVPVYNELKNRITVWRHNRQL